MSEYKNYSEEYQNKEVDKTEVQWRDKSIEGDHSVTSQLFELRSDIENFVAPPLLEACQILYDKNIRTLDSVWKHSEALDLGKVLLVIDYDSLSEENKAIAETYGPIHQVGYQGQAMNTITLEIPVTPESSAEEIQKDANTQAQKFHWQPLTWAPTYSEAGMKEFFLGDPNAPYTLEDIQEWVEDTAWYYDQETKTFYRSKEHYDKIHQTNPENKASTQ